MYGIKTNLCLVLFSISVVFFQAQNMWEGLDSMYSYILSTHILRRPETFGPDTDANREKWRNEVCCSSIFIGYELVFLIICPE